MGTNQTHTDNTGEEIKKKLRLCELSRNRKIQILCLIFSSLFKICKIHWIFKAPCDVCTSPELPVQTVGGASSSRAGQRMGSSSPLETCRARDVTWPL